MADGCCVWFTGLPCAGKTTLAERLAEWLEKKGMEAVIFDGDAVRQTVSANLGFSREHRHANVKRVAEMAAGVVQGGGVAICALVSPYRDSRAIAREIVGSADFVEVFVDTPIEICEGRDVKGMYGRARAGTLEHFTGVSDPYEPPEHPEVRVVGEGDPEVTILPILQAIERRVRDAALTTKPIASGSGDV
jgi:adenylyl-sulfate kinase